MSLLKSHLKNNSRLIAPSILSANFADLKSEIQKVEKGGADWLHVDVMDGHFVPNLTMGPAIVKVLKKNSTLPLDCHFMVTDPEKWIEPFGVAGASVFTFHIEVGKDRTPQIIEKIRAKNMSPGLSLNPATPIEILLPYIGLVDLVLVMSVVPGFSGQTFMAEVMTKVSKLVEAQKKNSFLIEIDGGIDLETIGTAKKAGCNVAVAGNAIFSKPDPAQAVKELKQKFL